MLAGWCGAGGDRRACATLDDDDGDGSAAPPPEPTLRRGTTGSSTGSGWRSSPPAASTCSSSSGRGSCCATPRSPVATPARTSGSPTSCSTTSCRGGSPAGRPTSTPGSRPGSSTSRSRRVLIVAPRRRPARTTSRSSSSPRSARCCCRSARTCSAGASASRGRRAPLFAVAATAFLFFKDGGDATMTFDHHIMGGTLASTLAGEYSFTIALALRAVASWARLARALDRRRRRPVAPGGAPRAHASRATSSSRVFAVVRRGRHLADLAAAAQRARGVPSRSARSVCCSPRSGSLPLAATLGYTTDMRYEPIGTDYLDWMFLSEMTGSSTRFARRSRSAPGSGTAAGATLDRRRDHGRAPAWSSAAGSGCATSSARRRRGTCGCCRSGTSCCILLAALGVAELARLGRARSPRGSCAARRAGTAEPTPTTPTCDRRRPATRTTRCARRAVAPEPRALRRATAIVGGVLAVLARRPSRSCACTRRAGFVPYWARYNYTGYEGGSRRRLHREVVARVPRVHRHRERAPAGSHGCGRASSTHRRVRHAARADAAAVLDRRAHPVDGGPLLRGVGDDAVPLHDDRDAHASQPSNPVRGLAVPVDRRLRPRRALPPAAWASATTPRSASEAKDDGGGEPGAARGRDRARPRRRARRAAGRSTRSPTSPTVQAAALRARGRRRPARGAELEVRRASRARRRHVRSREFSAWECLAVPWFNDPDALDRPLTDDGPDDRGSAPTLPTRATSRSRRCPTVEVSNVRTTTSRRSSSTCRAPASR